MKDAKKMNSYSCL